MPITLHAMSGSPYAWRVQMALVHKGLPHTVNLLSYDAGDFRSPAFAALNPRRRVPVIEQDGFVLYESAAILDYLEDIAPTPPLLAAEPRNRAIQRRLIREADQYVATELEHLVQAVFYTPPEQRDPARIAALWQALRAELALWEQLIEGEFLAGPLSAADLTLYPMLALIARRMVPHQPAEMAGEMTGPRLAAWIARMEALPLVRTTWPPHWGAPPAD